MKARITYLLLTLITLVLCGCNPEADEAYRRGLQDGQAQAAKEAQSQKALIARLQAQQKKDAFDSACSASLVCGLYRRTSAVAPPRSDAQPDPRALAYYTKALRVGDGMAVGTFACLLCLLWMPLQWVRYRLKLAEQEARLTDIRATHEALLNDIAEAKQEQVTLEHARQQIARDLGSSMAELMRRQRALTALQDAKARLERELVALRKAHTTQKNQLRLSVDQPNSTQATARSIFESKKSD